MYKSNFFLPPPPSTILSFHITVRKKLLANTEHQYIYLIIIKKTHTDNKNLTLWYVINTEKKSKSKQFGFSPSILLTSLSDFRWLLSDIYHTLIQNLILEGYTPQKDLF